MGKELLILGFNITNQEILAKIQGIWAKRNNISEKGNILGRSREDTQAITSEMVGGSIELIDPDSKNITILSSINVRAPMGLYYDKFRKMIFTGSDHWIYGVANGEIQYIINNRFFNCIHGISETVDNKLLITSTGIDAIFKIDLNKPDRLLHSWFATEHGFERSVEGNIRFVDRTVSHQGIEYSTREHTTHVNSAIEYKKNKLLATLFHQGQLVEIDFLTGESKVIFSGLKNPHGIRQSSFGFILSDTNGLRIIKFNRDLDFIGEINGSFRWIQDTVELENGNFAVADANNGRIVIIDPIGKIINEYIYGYDKKKIGVLLPIKASEATNIFGRY